MPKKLASMNYLPLLKLDLNDFKRDRLTRRKRESIDIWTSSPSDVKAAKFFSCNGNNIIIDTEIRSSIRVLRDK